MKLTEITMPFGLLRASDHSWWDDVTFRQAKPEPTKPSINWSHVSDEYNWLAQEESGTAVLHSTKPTKLATLWYSPCASNAKPFRSYIPGTCDWEDSLVMRPGYEGN